MKRDIALATESTRRDGTRQGFAAPRPVGAPLTEPAPPRTFGCEGDVPLGTARDLWPPTRIPLIPTGPYPGGRSLA